MQVNLFKFSDSKQFLALTVAILLCKQVMKIRKNRSIFHEMDFSKLFLWVIHKPPKPLGQIFGNF